MEESLDISIEIRSHHFETVVRDPRLTSNKISEIYLNNTKIYIYCHFGKQFYEALIIGIYRHLSTEVITKIRIHYVGWSKSYDEEIEIPNARLQLSNPFVVVVDSDIDEGDDMSDDENVNDDNGNGDVVVAEKRKWSNYF